MNRNRNSVVWITAFLYPALMAALWASTRHPYSDAHLIMNDRWWFIAGIALITVGLARATDTRIQFSRKIGVISWLAIVPVLLLVVGGVDALHQPGTDNRVAALTILGTLFVGIGEETAYRGIIFNRLASKMTITKAVFFSSVLFGLLHSVNVMRQDLSPTITQVFMTSIMGLAFAWTYVASRGNLVLVASMHWLYDASLIAPQASTAGANSLPVAAALLLLASITMTIHGFIKYRGRTWAEVLFN